MSTLQRGTGHCDVIGAWGTRHKIKWQNKSMRIWGMQGGEERVDGGERKITLLPVWIKGEKSLCAFWRTSILLQGPALYGDLLCLLQAALKSFHILFLAAPWEDYFLMFNKCREQIQRATHAHTHTHICVQRRCPADKCSILFTRRYYTGNPISNQTVCWLDLINFNQRSYSRWHINPLKAWFYTVDATKTSAYTA